VAETHIGWYQPQWLPAHGGRSPAAAMSVMFLKVRASCEASGQPLTSRTRIVYARRLRFDVGMSPRSIPPKLYKYRRFDVFCLRLLTQAEVSYSDPRTFNDPLDCDPTIEVAGQN